MTRRGDQHPARSTRPALAIVLLACTCVLLTGCQWLSPWHQDAVPDFEVPVTGGEPTVDYAQAVAALNAQGFHTGKDGPSIVFGLHHELYAYAAIGYGHANPKELPDTNSEPKSEVNHTSACNLYLTVMRDGGGPASRSSATRRTQARILSNAAAQVRGALLPHCPHSEELSAMQLANAIWTSNLKFELNNQSGDTQQGPALTFGAGGDWGKYDDGWDVSVHLYRSTAAADEAMQQQAREDEYQSSGEEYENPDLARYEAAPSYFQACNAVFSIDASLGDGPHKNPFVARAEQYRKRVRAAADSVREACSEP